MILRLNTCDGGYIDIEPNNCLALNGTVAHKIVFALQKEVNTRVRLCMRLRNPEFWSANPKIVSVQKIDKL